MGSQQATTYEPQAVFAAVAQFVLQLAPNAKDIRIQYTVNGHRANVPVLDGSNESTLPSPISLDSAMDGATWFGAGVRRLEVELFDGRVQKLMLPNVNSVPVVTPEERAFNAERKALWIAARKRRMASKLVYFIRSNGLVKIGIARDPLVRMKHLQTSNGNKLELLHTRPGGRKEERRLHRLFAAQRVNLNSEWFKLDEVILGFIEQSKTEIAAAKTNA